MGMRLGEGPAPAAPGHIRAYDVRTGKLVWRFHTIPHPGEPGYETWPPNAYQYIGGANVWTGLALDEKRGIVFCPTGSAAFDFWGGNRIGQNLFANCLHRSRRAHRQAPLALPVRASRPVGSRPARAAQPCSPFTQGGKKIDAVAQVTKSGHVFVFNRETGEPLFPIRGTARADVRSAGRIRLAHAAAPDEARAVRPAAFHLR